MEMQLNTLTAPNTRSLIGPPKPSEQETLLARHVAVLEERFHTQLERTNKAEQHNQNVQKAIEELGQFIIAAANDNDLCEVFDQVVEEWNNRKTLAPLPVRLIEETEVISFYVTTTRPYGVDPLDSEVGYLDSAATEAMVEHLTNEGFTYVDVSS